MSEKRELKETLLFEKNHRIHGGIYHKMQVDFAYNSNHIEGSRLTHEQTCYIFETQSVDGAVFVNDVFETANHFRCLDWVLDTISEPLSEEYVKQMHRILKTGLMTQQNPEAVIGDYKKYANVVGGIETAKPGEVSAQMAQLLQTYQNLQQPDFYEIAWFHMAFEKIHPFYDGNGRVGRLLLLKMCLENDIVPFYINSESKMFYYAGLKAQPFAGRVPVYAGRHESCAGLFRNRLRSHRNHCQYTGRATQKVEAVTVLGQSVEGNPFEKGFSLKFPSENFTLFL